MCIRDRFTSLCTNWDLLHHSSSQALIFHMSRGSPLCALLHHSSSQALIFQAASYSSEVEKLLATRRAQMTAVLQTAQLIGFVRWLGPTVSLQNCHLSFSVLQRAQLASAIVVHSMRLTYSLKIALVEDISEQLLSGAITSCHQVTRFVSLSHLSHTYT